MVESVSDIAGGLSGATRGSDNPDTMTISRPTKEAIWAVFVVLIVVAVMGFFNTYVLAWGPFGPETALERVKWLGWGNLLAWLCIAAIVFAIVSSRIARIDATVGGAHIDLTGTAGN